ncbi:hypothetical protein D3C80_1849500 [compost metagenome]
MVLHQRDQGLLQCRSVQWLARLQQHCLVPVLRLGHLAVEEPVLDRRQAAVPLAQALLDASWRGAQADHGGQGLDSLVLE